MHVSAPKILAVLAGIFFLSVAPAGAEDSFAGKTITIVVGYGPGGGYDAYARLAAGHLGQFLPGHPTILVENMEGGGARRSEVYLATAAPKDGTVLSVVPSSIALESVEKQIPGGLDAGKFKFIGRLASETLAIVTARSSATKTFEDAERRETIIGALSFSDITVILPRVLNAMLGTKFKIVEGYKGSAEMVLAMDRGETEAVAFGVQTIEALHPDWLDKKTVNFVSMVALNRHPDFPDVPALIEFATNDEQRAIIQIVCSPAAIGKSLAAPPGVSDETVAVLRKGFDAMIKDPDFRAEAVKRKLPIDDARGDEVQRTAAAVMASSPEVIAKLLQILNGS